MMAMLLFCNLSTLRACFSHTLPSRCLVTRDWSVGSLSRLWHTVLAFFFFFFLCFLLFAPQVEGYVLHAVDSVGGRLYQLIHVIQINLTH